ncbi:MAG: type II toxin-antitoxin system prevent-host-death family antitoxin [Acetobacteraceae bacterium]|nr:type II toxin-antitoxin system prevent-host-death family antitoxin [Acetobacteraceae bacterium]
MQVNIYEAKTRLSALVDAATRGEEVVIARAGKPLVRLVPCDTPAPPPRLGGQLEHLGSAGPDEAWAPLTDEELKDWYRE